MKSSFRELSKITLFPLLLLCFSMGVFVVTLQTIRLQFGQGFDFVVILPALSGLLCIFLGAGIFFYLFPKSGVYPLLWFHFFLGILWILLPQIQLTNYFSYLALVSAVFVPPTFLHFALMSSEMFVQVRKWVLFYRFFYLASLLFLIPYLYFFGKDPSLWIQFNRILILYGIFVYLFWIAHLIRIINRPHLELDRITARWLLLGQLVGFIIPCSIVAAIFLVGFTIPLNFLSPLILLFPVSLALGLIPSQRRQRDTYVVQSEKRSTFGNLLSGLAHELNNPMTFIYSNLEPIRESLQELKNLVSPSNERIPKIFSKLERMIHHLEEGVTRAKTLIENFRQFPNPRPEEKEEVDLREIIEPCIELLSHKFKDRIQIEKKFEEIPKIRGFRGELNQVFTNLLANAFDSIAGKGTVFVSTQKGAGGIKIVIGDTGKGISTKEMGKIFDPFFTTKKQGEGTGLGLSIALQLVMNHKGSIEVKSKEGKGTEFIVFLPY
jgi:signal transduction histidine kinase